MAGITLEQAEARLAEYLAAEAALLAGGQSYTIKDRQFTRADMRQIQEGIDVWNKRVQDLSRPRSGRRVRGFSPAG